jgi:heat shock protein HslJ
VVGSALSSDGRSLLEKLSPLRQGLAGQYLVRMKRSRLMAICGVAFALGALVCPAVSGCGSGDPETRGEFSGTSWELTSYSAGTDGLVSVLDDTLVNVTFAENGDFAGLAGCNSYWGTYTTDADELSIESIVSSSLSCIEPAGIMGQEEAYLNILPEVATFEINGDTLELRAADGSLLVSYEAWTLPPGGLFHGGSPPSSSP